MSSFSAGACPGAPDKGILLISAATIPMQLANREFNRLFVFLNECVAVWEETSSKSPGNVQPQSTNCELRLSNGKCRHKLAASQQKLIITNLHSDSLKII